MALEILQVLARVPADERIEIKELPIRLSVADMLEFFRCDRYKTWDLIDKKKIKAVKDGKEWKIQTASVLKYYRRLEAKQNRDTPEVEK